MMTDMCRCGHALGVHEPSSDAACCIRDCVCVRYVPRINITEDSKPTGQPDEFTGEQRGAVKSINDSWQGSKISINLKGVGPDVPVVYNDKGAGQSHSPYRFDLLPPLACADIAEIMAHGAVKYGEGSYLNIDAKDHLNHAMQHIFAFQTGDTQEGEVIEHAKHAACRMLFWLECLERKLS